jgi:sulfoxide reductase heme-binding subunit YedZ
MTARRVATHLVLGVLTAVVLLLAPLYPRAETFVQAATIGLGYLSLGLIAATLVVGPLGLRRRSRNPVNVYLRRDLGIWAGLTGLAHVLFGLQVHFGGNVIRYFFQPIVRERYFAVGDEERYFRVVEGWTPATDLFGLANWIGLLATVVLLILLALSNDVAVRALRGPRWKALQRFNYALVALVVAHTAAYQLVVGREAVFALATLALAGVVLGAQLVGVTLYRRRRRPSPSP